MTGSDLFRKPTEEETEAFSPLQFALFAVLHDSIYAKRFDINNICSGRYLMPDQLGRQLLKDKKATWYNVAEITDKIINLLRPISL